MHVNRFFYLSANDEQPMRRYKDGNQENQPPTKKVLLIAQSRQPIQTLISVSGTYLYIN